MFSEPSYDEEGSLTYEQAFSELESSENAIGVDYFLSSIYEEFEMADDRNGKNVLPETTADAFRKIGNYFWRYGILFGWIPC